MNGIVAQLEEQETLNLKVASSTLAGPTKVCNKCKVEKLVTEFHKRKKGWQPYCKECKKEDDAAYRLQNMKYFEERAKKQTEVLRKWHRELKEKPCTDCKKEFDPVCMQWDHVAGEKIGNVGSLVNKGNRKKIEAEIAKCELVCANCHALRTKNRK